MHDQESPTKSAEILRGLLERLGSPELTLSEASTLRCQVARFLGEAPWASCDDRIGRASSCPSR